MLRLISLIFLNPRPLLQPNEEEKKEWDKFERKLSWKIRLAVLGTFILFAGSITAIMLLVQ
jgi:hypothetical protein